LCAELLEYGADVNAQGSAYSPPGRATKGKKSPEKLLRLSYLQHRTAFSTTARLVKNDGGHLVGQLPPPMNGLESATLLMDECAVVKQPPHKMASGGKAVSALWCGEKKT
jgi:hypothetical protein